jgi:hypothetical protein
VVDKPSSTMGGPCEWQWNSRSPSLENGYAHPLSIVVGCMVLSVSSGPIRQGLRSPPLDRGLLCSRVTDRPTHCRRPSVALVVCGGSVSIRCRVGVLVGVSGVLGVRSFAQNVSQPVEYFGHGEVPTHEAGSSPVDSDP